MTRRQARNKTGIARLPEDGVHDAWAAYVCVRCSELNVLRVGETLWEPQFAFESGTWDCKKCGFTHDKAASLPFPNWPKQFSKGGSIPAERFWLGFFRISTEHPESYWKWCNSCGRVLPFNAFSKHTGWGPLERQMECRSCKGGINADLNVKRTAEQLHEGSRRRRAAELLLEGENQNISVDDLFCRFGSRCFKTQKLLKRKDRTSWAIDHILPSTFLYPLTVENAALLSKEANNNKRDKWPSSYYTNNELVDLCKITGADLELLASRAPILNANVDVDACVDRSLKVREKSDLPKRIRELKWLLAKYKLVSKLSSKNKRMLGF